MLYESKGVAEKCDVGSPRPAKYERKDYIVFEVAANESEKATPTNIRDQNQSHTGKSEP